MGVTTPKSRRILLSVLTQMAQHHHHHDNDPSLLQGLFQQSLRPLLQITETSLNQNGTNVTEHDLFTCCESILDIASFPSPLVATLFDDTKNNHEISHCLEQIIQIIKLGYTELLSTEDPNHHSTLLIQWSRLRASVVLLFQTSANPTLPSSIVNVLSTLIHTECHAAMIQLNSTTNTKISNLFHKCVIGDDILPAGVYLMIHSNVLSSILKNNNNGSQQQMIAIQDCLLTLNASKTHIFQLLLHQSTSSSNSNNHSHLHYIDPTSAIAEAWFSTLKSVLLVIQKSSSQLQQNQQLMLDLQTCICETFAFCIQLIWNKPLEKDLRKQQQDHHHFNGMSLDGPQTLIMMDFMELALLTFNTCAIMKYISSTFKNQQQYQNSIHIEIIQNQQNQIIMTEEELVGGGIWISSLYRGTIGVLPPWILERIPKLYQLLFDQQLCQQNVSSFCTLLLLGGRYCGPDVISEKALHDFVSKCHDLLIQNQNPWRQFKAFFKAVCGGKKKATTFQLKPQPTCWNCDRI